MCVFVFVERKENTSYSLLYSSLFLFISFYRIKVRTDVSHTESKSPTNIVSKHVNESTYI